MKRSVFLLLSVVLLMPQSGFACGEGIYTMSEGSRHRGYLAPRLATVLIYNDQAVVPEASKTVYRGLASAGHRVNIARNPGQLATALEERRYDVVIADYDRLDVIDRQIKPVSKTRVLPIVSSQHGDASGRNERFRFSLSEDASLRQYLRLIDRLVKDVV